MLGIRTKVKSLLDLCRENKITPDLDKFVISCKIEVGGFEISCDESDSNPMIKPTKLAVNKVTEFPEPQTKKDIQRFVGLMNTLRHLSNKLNGNCPNIRALASKNSEWSWNETHKEEFRRVKQLASNINFLSPYDLQKEIFLQTNGSKTRVGNFGDCFEKHPKN